LTCDGIADLQQQLNNVYVRVLNRTCSPVRLKAGTVLATATPIDASTLGMPNSAAYHRLPPIHTVARGTKLPSYEREHLGSSQQQQVDQLLMEYADLFSQGPHDLGQTDAVEHTINTHDARPIQDPPRRVPVHHQEALRASERC